MLRSHATFPSFSPHSDLIAVNGNFVDKPGLTVLRSDGSHRWTLLKEPNAFYAAWSPKEEGVIFTSLGPIFKDAGSTAHIARVSFNLADLRDGVEEVAVSVKTLTAEGTGNNGFPSCSPDGKFVVFRSGRSGNMNLYVVDAVESETSDGGGIRRLTDGYWVDTMPVWSPDGEMIAFSSNRYDPSNARAFSAYLIRPDGTDLPRVHVADPHRERINHLCFSTDGRHLLFTANLAGITADPVSMPNHFQPYGDLFVCDLHGAGATRLTFSRYENGTPTWTSAVASSDDGALSSTGVTLGGHSDELLWITCDI